MLPIRDLWTVNASAGYGAAPRSKKYVSKYFHGFFITINSMILYFKHIIHIDDFPLNGQPLSIFYSCLLSVITHPSRCVWLNSVSICLTNTLFTHWSLPIFTSLDCCFHIIYLCSVIYQLSATSFKHGCQFLILINT